MDTVRAEVEDTVKRFRHHACLALWCGNNEMEQGWVGNEWNDREIGDHQQSGQDEATGLSEGKLILHEHGMYQWD